MSDYVLVSKSNQLNECSSMEVVGRFGTDKEAENLQISVKTPVWLPVNDKELNATLKDHIKKLR